MFYGADKFPFLDPLQRHWKVMLEELRALDKTYFMDWPERNIYQGKWTVFGLYSFGSKLEEHCALCPQTTRLVEAIPGMTTAGFSAMAPNTHITPHVGYTSEVLRCHVGLVTPPECGIRVGGESRTWQPGSCFVFDDTNEHEAWNRSGSMRVILLADFRKAGAQATLDDAMHADRSALRGVWSKGRQN